MVTLDKSAVREAMDAFWEAPGGGNENGVEAAITTYLTRMRLARHHETVVAENQRIALRVARQPAHMTAAE